MRALLWLLPLAALGCTPLFYRLVIPRLYREVPLPEQQVLLDVAYRSGPDAHPRKHRLDLFLPDGSAAARWPVLVFVHGGGWTTGDKSLRAAGADVYGNIGRCFAREGIGVAVVNYRLLPEVDWRAQIRDVAEAVGWVRRNVGSRGGDPDALYLAGHSAGAWLVAQVVLEPEMLARAGVPASSLCGWVPVSGSGYDLIDQESYELGARRFYYEERFASRRGDDSWMLEASPVLLADASAPPSLVLHAEKDWPPLRRQSRLLFEALRAAGAGTRLLAIPGVGHRGVVLALSRPGEPAVSAILAFVRNTPCPR